jgi:anti-sigma B factor antagonist
VSETDLTSAGPDGFRCDVHRNGSSAWVRPAGELDLETVHHVEAALASLRADGCGDLILDLRSLTFMDSTGLRLAIRWDTAARETGFAFAIVPGVGVVQRVFRVSGMDDHLKLADPTGEPEA